MLHVTTTTDTFDVITQSHKEKDLVTWPSSKRKIDIKKPDNIDPRGIPSLQITIADQNNTEIRVQRLTTIEHADENTSCCKSIGV